MTTLFDKLYKTGLYSDCSISINGLVYNLHKEYINKKSDYFLQVYFGTDMRQPTIQITDYNNNLIEPKYIEFMLKYLYDDDVTQFYDLKSNILMYILFDFLQIEPVYEQCIKNILNFLHLELCKYENYSLKYSHETAGLAFCKHPFNDKSIHSPSGIPLHIRKCIFNSTNGYTRSDAKKYKFWLLCDFCQTYNLITYAEYTMLSEIFANHPNVSMLKYIIDHNYLKNHILKSDEMLQLYMMKVFNDNMMSV
jgi:hypothetical protein